MTDKLDFSSVGIEMKPCTNYSSQKVIESDMLANLLGSRMYEMLANLLGSRMYEILANLLGSRLYEILANLLGSRMHIQGGYFFFEVMIKLIFYLMFAYS